MRRAAVGAVYDRPQSCNLRIVGGHRPPLQRRGSRTELSNNSGSHDRSVGRLCREDRSAIECREAGVRNSGSEASARGHRTTNNRHQPAYSACDTGSEPTWTEAHSYGTCLRVVFKKLWRRRSVTEPTNRSGLTFRNASAVEPAKLLRFQ